MPIGDGGWDDDVLGEDTLQIPPSKANHDFMLCRFEGGAYRCDCGCQACKWHRGA